MKILCLTKRTPKDLLCFDTTYMSYAQLKGLTDLNVGFDIITVDGSDGGLFTPYDIGTRAWLDATEADTLDETGNVVTSWSDKKNNGVILEQPVVLNKPTTNVQTYNGKNTVSFSGGQNLSGLFDWPSFGNYAVYMVVKNIGTAGGEGALISAGGGLSDKDWSYLVNTNQMNAEGDNIFTSFNLTNSVGTSDVRIFELVFNGKASQIKSFLEGVANGTSTTYSAKTEATGLRLAAKYNAGDENLDVHIGEIIITTDITDFTRYRLEGYLAHKWGLTTALSTDHPYKAEHPTVDGVIRVADLSAMMAENTNVMNAADWDALSQEISEPLMTAYKTRAYIPSQRFTLSDGKVKIVANTTEAVGIDIDVSLFHMDGLVAPMIVSSSHTTKITESYGSVSNPGLRNIKFLRHRLRELIFTHKSLVTPEINFNNTIPVVSGKIHYPVVYENELYAMNGSRSLGQVPEGGISNVLIDFTKIGDIELVRFPDCTAESRGVTTTITIPEGKSFTNKSVLFVVGGRFVMSNEFHILNDRSFAFNPWAIPLKNIILSNMAIWGEKLDGTTMYNDTDPSGTFEVEMMEPSNYDNFIIIINNPSVEFYMLKSDMTLRPNVLRFPLNSGGVLMKNMTREIVDYSRELESNQTIAYLAPTKPLNRLTNEVSDNMHNIAYQTSNVPNFDHSINDKDDGFTLIDIVAEEL